MSRRVRLYLDTEGMLYDPARTCSREALLHVLEREELPTFTSALDLEEAFGGILSSPDETVLLLGTFQALLHQRETGRYSVDEHAKTLETDGSWPHVRWRDMPLLPVGHWHGIGDLYIDETGVIYGYQWNDDALRAAAGGGHTLLESIALWWETYEMPQECPPSFEASVRASIAAEIARALSAALVEEASDGLCARFRNDDVFIEEIAAAYAGGPLTTVWADKKTLLEAMRIARDLAPEARIEARQDYGGDVSTMLRDAGIFPS
ncbi:uncharacterized protein SOCEGT47_002830 [Sorangium cellulosum]|uniref:Uncharacterized protein n=2 Tax=Sorangium cellulosum TaxID=56 RepID=A0A4P2PTH2_SORCE|nr:uncharacterized protein SOCEGT47_002830 [Sorangium cellulosum]